MRGWAWFTAAALFGAGACGYVGWERYSNLIPPVSATLRPGEGSALPGARLHFDSLRVADRVDALDADGSAVAAPTGAKIVALTVTLTVSDAATVERLGCDGYLEAGGQEWKNDWDVASKLGSVGVSFCATGLGVSKPKTSQLFWVVPASAAADYRIQLRFADLGTSIGLRP